MSLIFLMTMIVLFTGYPMLLGGFSPNGDPFMVSAIILFSLLVTLIYYLVQEPENYTSNLNTHSRIARRLIFVIIAALFLLLIPILCFVIIDPKGLIVKDLLIAIVAGLVSGVIVALIDWAYSNKNRI
ncbi:MAG: hypothetical protein ABFC78_05470 [Methanoregula sp.]